GTLLLDEIGELSPESQSKLLRVLEEKEFYPVGSTQMCSVDVRIIASTNKDLKDAVRKNLFREDLFYRLDVLAITIPPLRSRMEDILPLAHFFLRNYGSRSGKDFREIAPDAAKLLLQYPWKGNIRELRNLIERVVLSETGPVVKKEYL